MANDDQISRKTWYAQPNDEVGGWCVMTTPDPPSAAVGRMVATFTTEADALRIADLHNAEAPRPTEPRFQMKPYTNGPTVNDQRTAGWISLITADGVELWRAWVAPVPDEIWAALVRAADCPGVEVTDAT